MYSMKEVTGAPNETARYSSPKDGLSLERFYLDAKDDHYTGFHNTFCLQVDKREPTFTLPEKGITKRDCFLKRF